MKRNVQPNTNAFYLVPKTAQGSICDKEGGQSHDVQKIVKIKKKGIRIL
jgi:hypothetical protein